MPTLKYLISELLPKKEQKQYIPLRINSEKYMLMELSAPVTFPSEIFILWVV